MFVVVVVDISELVVEVVELELVANTWESWVEEEEVRMKVLQACSG